METSEESLEEGISTNEKNYVQLMFTFLVLTMILFSSLINTFEKYLPAFLSRSFRYGKFACKENVGFIVKSEVPKAWFKHFYLFSSVLSVATLHFVINAYVFGIRPPLWLKYFLDQNFGIYRYASVTPAHVLLATILMTIQCLKRFYDTHFVSVFGKNSKMNFTHYIIGIAHYYGAILTIISEAPMFAITQKNEDLLKLEDLTQVDYFISVIFLLACWQQHVCSVKLANLRKDKTGKVVTQEHKIATGGLFNYVSSPHLFTEKLMYICLTVILWGNITWIFVLAWVLANQVETALLSHWWYQTKFGSKYPKNRKAVIPFIY